MNKSGDLILILLAVVVVVFLLGEVDSRWVREPTPKLCEELTPYAPADITIVTEVDGRDMCQRSRYTPKNEFLNEMEVGQAAVWLGINQDEVLLFHSQLISSADEPECDSIGCLIGLARDYVSVQGFQLPVLIEIRTLDRIVQHEFR